MSKLHKGIISGLCLVLPFWLLLAWALSGCVSMPEITPEQASMHRAEEATQATCYQAQQMMSGQMWGALAKVPDEDRAMAMMLMANQLNTQQMLAVATGKSLDPCSGDSNFHDVEIAYLKAQGQLVGQYIDAAKWGVGLGLGYAAWNSTVNALADAGGTYYSASENAKLNVNSQNKDSWNTAGRDVTTSGDHNLVNNNDDCIDCDQDKSEEGEPEVRSDCSVDADCLEGSECVDNRCVEPGQEPTSDFDIEACLDNPPGGVNSYGTPMYNAYTSCKSFWQTGSPY